MDTLMICAKIQAARFKESVHEFLHKERGGAEIVATIVLVAIVVLLAVAFREQLVSLVQGIWSGITDKAGEINQDIDLGSTTP